MTSPVSTRRTQGWVLGRRLVLATGLIAAIPVIVSTVAALRAGWTPVFDDAAIATNAYDTLAHGRAVGVYSDATLPQIGAVFNAGPLLLWILAIPARLPGEWALPLTAGLINVASIAGAVALARRRGGQALMLATAAALVLLSRSYSAETLHDILNASIGLLPLVLLLFLAWSLACGEYRLAPLTALVGSFVLQSHASLAAPAIPVLAVAVVGLAFQLRERRGAGAPGAPRAWLLAAAAVVVVCWAPPVIQQVAGSPGNLGRLVRTATAGQRTLGTTVSWHALVRSVGIPPWWLSRSQPGGVRFFSLFGPPGTFATISCLLILLGSAVAAVVALRRRRRDVLIVVALALAFSGIAALSVGATPARLAIFVSKATQTAQLSGMFLWLALGYSVAVLATPLRGRAAAARASRLARPAPLIAASAVLVLLAVLVAAGRTPDDFQAVYRPVTALAAKVEARVPRSGNLLVISAERASILRAGALSAGLVYQLRRRGYHPVIPDSTNFVAKFGPAYSRTKHPPADELVIDDRLQPTQSGARLVARAFPTRVASALPYRPITLSVLKSGGARICPPPTPPARLAVASVGELRPREPGLQGYVDKSGFVGEAAEICGWAASTKLHRAADAVTLVVDGRIVAVVRPAIARPDVLRGLPAVGATRTGFSLEVPRRLLPRSGADVRLLAVVGRAGTAIPLGCRRRTNRVGCP